MRFLSFADDQTVKRLRWVMIAVMLFSMLNSLAGQPNGFWHNPEMAMRGDGLGVHSRTNHSFEFFMSRGWQPYVISCLIYFSLMFFIVSILPRTLALITIFTVILGHGFGVSNWLLFHWHLGAMGAVVCGTILSTIIIFSAFPSPAIGITKKLRWLMLFSMISDFGNTLFAQPASYWRHPETMIESNPISRIFMGYGWVGYSLYDLIYLPGVFLLVSMLPRRIGLVCVLSFIFGHYVAVANWLFYRWRLGMEAPVVYGLLISIAIVLLAFSPRQKVNATPFIAFEPTATIVD